MKSTNATTAKDFLSLLRRGRPARLINVVELPRPKRASLQEDGFLNWEWDRKLRTHRPPATLCFDFARLAEASNTKICAFAGKWGPLAFGQRFEEHADDWRRYARVTQALLRFVGHDSVAGRGSEDDWRTICEWLGISSDNASLSSLGKFKMEITAVDVVNHKLQVRPHASNLFGILITQIAHAVARSDQQSICSGCGVPFVLKRRPSRGVRCYCAVCRKKRVPRRDAARDLRRRNRLEKTSVGKDL